VNASQGLALFLLGVGGAGNDDQFVWRRGRGYQPSRRQPGANGLDGVNGGFAALAQVHQHIRVNGDERAVVENQAPLDSGGNDYRFPIWQAQSIRYPWVRS